MERLVLPLRHRRPKYICWAPLKRLLTLKIFLGFTLLVMVIHILNHKDTGMNSGTWRSVHTGDMDENSNIDSNQEKRAISEPQNNEKLSKSNTEEIDSPKIEKAVTLKNGRQETYLFIGIFSYYRYTLRRKALRETWLQYCRPYSRCSYRFLLDRYDHKGKIINESITSVILDESSANKGDVELLDTFAGWNFGYRMYYTLVWLTRKYSFEYFLRTDDDQYLCLLRLMQELPLRKEKNLYWGYQHCNKGNFFCFY